MDPYRVQAVRPDISFEAEVEAIKHVAERKQKVTGIFAGIGLVLGGIAGFPLFLYYDGNGDLALVRFFGPMHLAIFTAIVPLLITSLLGKLWLRKNRDRWIADASVRFNVPAKALEWVMRDPE